MNATFLKSANEPPVHLKHSGYDRCLYRELYLRASAVHFIYWVGVSTESMNIYWRNLHNQGRDRRSSFGTKGIRSLQYHEAEERLSLSAFRICLDWVRHRLPALLALLFLSGYSHGRFLHKICENDRARAANGRTVSMPRICGKVLLFPCARYIAKLNAFRLRMNKNVLQAQRVLFIWRTPTPDAHRKRGHAKILPRRDACEVSTVNHKGTKPNVFGNDDLRSCPKERNFR